MALLSLGCVCAYFGPDWPLLFKVHEN